MFILVLGYKNEQPSSRATKWRGDPNEQRAVTIFGLLRRLKRLLAMTVREFIQSTTVVLIG
ncbi:hypothetical protein [Candidatus Tisiphia endosymbiont of Oplodontha viridula]|uniref:hypothetical protein n=1 Tax=Candidatus Tisiphia endosymbiont of Oplodontha viridula TaxID=3077925 RepID=UPI0035C9159C